MGLTVRPPFLPLPHPPTPYPPTPPGAGPAPVRPAEGRPRPARRDIRADATRGFLKELKQIRDEERNPAGACAARPTRAPGPASSA